MIELQWSDALSLNLAPMDETHREFVALMQSKGAATPDEEILEDAVAFTGVSKYPARVKCALLSLKVVKSGAYGIHEWPDEEEE